MLPPLSPSWTPIALASLFCRHNTTPVPQICSRGLGNANSNLRPASLNAGTVKLKNNKPMKLKLLPIFVAFSLTAFVSCENKESSEANSPADSSTAESDYPLETCVVSGEKLGSMGEPFVITHDGTEVRFCCDSCVPKFKKDPAKYLAKLKK